MSLLALVLILSVVALLLRLPVFESVFGSLLLVPVFAHFIGLAVVPGAGIYYLLLVAIVAGLGFLRRKTLLVPGDTLPKPTLDDTIEEFLPVFVFALSFAGFRTLCLLWPDFIDMGERLRDYAILSSVLQSPVVPLEPWRSGAPLNYYIYWYRFGHLISSLLDLKTWETYHTMVAFSLAFFMSTGFVVFRRYALFSITNSLVASLLLAIGSNVEGVEAWIKRDENWWGPSRVIPGAINEFPAWSFLLGDLHPHYLNLSLIPFFLIVSLWFLKNTSNFGARLLLIGSMLVVAPLWVYNANAWELPIWLGTVFLLFAILLTSKPWAELAKWRQKMEDSWGTIDLKFLTLAALIGILGLSLVHSAWSIVPGKDPLRFVRDPILKTTITDLFRHWGLPLGLLTISTIVLLDDAVWIALAILSLGGSLLYENAAPFLYLLLLFTTYRVAQDTRYLRQNGGDRALNAAFFDALSVASIGLLLLPEVVFIDDNYGGVNERMNTIFKVYAVDWFLLHASAFVLTARASILLPAKLKNTAIELVRNGVLLVLFLGFFVFTASKLRTSKAPLVGNREQGLSELDNRFPGAEATISTLERLPRGPVLESEEGAYDYTAHVATLSGNFSYLGWVNHVQLLLWDSLDETSRRQKLVDDFYKEGSCEKRLETVKKEGIRYVVFGPLEKKKYPSLSEDGFKCFTPIAGEKEYKVYTVQP